MDNKDNLLIFSKLGKVFNLPVHKIPFSQKGINGTDIRQLTKKEIGSIAMLVPQSIIDTCTYYLIRIGSCCFIGYE
jgi:DNA gyrase/topoisomerase IV subunit A